MVVDRVLGFRFIFKFPHAELRTRMGSNTFSVQVKVDNSFSAACHCLSLRRPD